MVIMILFIVLLPVSVPIFATSSAVSLAPLLLDPNFYMSAKYIICAMLGGIDSFPLLVVPMFVLLNILMTKGGVNKKLFGVSPYLLGGRTAEMPYTVIVTCLLYDAISDSAPAAVAAVGSVMIPLSIRMGYNKVFATAVVTVVGSLGAIIPLSILFILFGMVNGASVGKMFMAGIVPEISIALLLMLCTLYYCKKHGKDKEKTHAEVSVLCEKRFVKVFLDNFWTLLIPVITLGCIYSGTASPTEAAVISMFYTLIISMCIYRTLKFRDSKDVLVEAIYTFVPILFILSAAAAFSRIITLLRIPEMAGSLILFTSDDKVAILLVINVLLLIVGMVTGISPAILILTLILIPITNSLGIDLVQFSVITVINLAIDFVTPPTDVNLFTASSLTDVPVMQIAKKVMPLIIFFLIISLAITLTPQISLLLIS